MLRSLFGGNFGLDILALTAIVATVAVGEYWPSLVIVLLLPVQRPPSHISR